MLDQVTICRIKRLRRAPWNRRYILRIIRLERKHNPRCRIMRKREAFTLIELLVVIAVIALLMAILLPTLQRVRRQAKAIACQSKLRQWGTLWATATSDNDGYFPGAGPDDRLPDYWPGRAWPDGPWGWGGAWGGLGGYPYGDPDWYKTTKGLWYCPTATKPADPSGPWFPVGGTFLAWTGWWPAGPRLWQDWYGSYGTNHWLWWSYWRYPDHRDEPYPRYFWRTAYVKGASNIPMMLDSTMPSAWGWWRLESQAPPECDAIPTARVRDTWDENPACINRHNGYVNGLFLDWSVRKVGLKQLWTLKRHREFNTRNRWTIAGGAKPEDWPQWMRRFRDY